MPPARCCARPRAAADGEVATLAERQLRIEEAAGRLVAATPAGSAAWRDVLGGLVATEMPQAVLALRDAATAMGGARRSALAKGEALEAAILARLKSLPADLRDETAGAAVRDLIGRVEALFNRQKALHGRTLKAVTGEGAAMAGDQDALADESRVVRQALADGAQNAVARRRGIPRGVRQGRRPDGRGENLRTNDPQRGTNRGRNNFPQRRHSASRC